MLAVRWYLRYGLSYRDVEELLAERGIDVDHVTIYRWVQQFTPLLIEAAKPCRHAVGNRWFVDETYVKVAGKWRYVYRAVDQHGQVIDIYVSKRRNIPAARRFFTKALTAHGEPVEVVTDLAQALETVIEEQIPDAFHKHRAVFEQSCRVRPRPTQIEAETDARPQNRPGRISRDSRTWVHSEPETKTAASSLTNWESKPTINT